MVHAALNESAGSATSGRARAPPMNSSRKLRAWQVQAEAIQSAELVVSELVTNARQAFGADAGLAGHAEPSTTERNDPDRNARDPARISAWRRRAGRPAGTRREGQRQLRERATASGRERASLYASATASAYAAACRSAAG